MTASISVVRLGIKTLSILMSLFVDGYYTLLNREAEKPHPDWSLATETFGTL